MTASRKYTVEQERTVTVFANSPTQAVQRAQEYFDGKKHPEGERAEVRVSSITARESY